MDPNVTMGIGLAILGIGTPVAVALLRLLPRRDFRKDVRREILCPVREHEARMGVIEKDIAVLQESIGSIRAILVRIEGKVDKLNDRGP